MSNSLHPIERKILSALAQSGTMSFAEVVKGTSLKEDQVRRALQWLSSKRLVAIDESITSRVEVVGKPPELILVERVKAAPHPVTVNELRSQFESSEAFSAAFGRAKSQRWINVDGSPPTVRVGTTEGLAALESVLASLAAGAPENSLTEQQKQIATDLLRRGILKRAETRSSTVTITGSGKASASTSVESGLLDKLTPEILASGSWKGKALRPIDVEARAPRFSPGRRHPVRDFIQEVRETYISMGFIELQGGSVHPGFWNFDALFIPQDHPSREMQDTFYLDGMADRRLTRTGVVANVAGTHEGGWKTGSRGWGYTWHIEEARRLVLRTHNTVLSVKALSESKEKETRTFAVSKVYRNENLDYKHLAEFYQMDGMMVGEGLNVRHLMGFLTEFYKKLGMAKIKLWPTYFPYTEPSLEVIGYSKAVGAWIELSGSGVFRPEVTVPLGVKVPVLAWGPGIERLMLIRYGLDDIRALYGDDLSWLRERREFARS